MTTQLRGTMLTPGVSANRRLYTPELIKKAYEKLTERLKDPSNPVTMLTYHAAGDDSTQIVGRITSVSMNGENLDYTAELAETGHANTIGALVAPKDGGKPFLRGVSIRGWWVGEPTTKMFEGISVTTADDMEVDGLDFTRSPGVSGAFATLDDVTATESSSGGERVLIRESVEARAMITEAANPKPYGSVRYADPGYQSDKVKRYPIDTKAHAKAAWSYVNQADNAKKYTAAQLKRIRARIKSALQKFGVNVANESSQMPEPLTEAATTISEYYPYDGPDGQAGFSISAYNGPLTVTVSAYNGVEPADLPDVAMAAMKAACDAIHAMDPDDDGDIDTGASETDSGDQMETAPASEDVKESEVSDTTETTAPEAAQTADETSASGTTPAPEAAEETSATNEESADTPITRAELAAVVAEAVAAALKTPAEGAAATAEESAETTEAVAETTEQDDAELRESIRLEVIRQAQETGVITRKGLVEKMGEPGEGQKQLHEMNDEEFRAYQAERSALFFAHNQ
jgi:hypothetical protein